MNGFHEQCDGVVTLDGSHKRLPILSAWANSSAVYWINPQAPATAMFIKVGNANKDGWNCSLKAYFHPKRGMYRVYVPGKYFTGHYETVYQIVEVDENDSRHISGEGALRVYKSSIQEAEEIQIVACAKWPDGLVREIKIREDETGAPVFSIGEVVEKEISQGEIYAFNNATGQFHLVTTFFDEVDEPMLTVSETPVNGGFDQFVADANGFYRRIECEEDDSGSMTLQTGEKRQ